MHSTIISWLNGRYGFDISEDYYRHIAVWEDWWRGYHEPFHRTVGYNGVRRVARDMYTLKMAKKVCEDWAAILINEKTTVKVADEQSEEFVCGRTGSEGVLGRNNFWVEGNVLMERMMYSGTAATIVRLKNASIAADGRLLSSADTEIGLAYVDAPHIVPLSCVGGEITEAAFVSNAICGGKRYIYLEVHRLDGGEYVIENHYFSADSGQLSETSLPEGVAAVVRTGSDTPWFALCQPAIANNIKGSGGLGLSVYANAIDNLKGVDLAFNNFCKDIYLGQKKVFVSRCLTALSDTGETLTPDDSNQQLFHFIGENFGTDGELSRLIAEHNPDLRIADNTAAVQAQLDYLAFKCGLGLKHYQFNSGSVVTATQYTGDKQDMIQHAHKHYINVERFLQSLTRTILYIGKSFCEADVDPSADIEVMFDRAPLIDELSERERDRQDVASGLMLPWEYRVKWYGESEETAKAILDSVPSDEELYGFTGGDE